MDLSFASAVVVLLLVVDPFGNIGLLVSVLREVPAGRRPRVIVREWLIALGALLAFLLFGEHVLRLLGLSEPSLSIAGGVILFLIALRMIFHTDQTIFGPAPGGEPLIVPLAIPAMAGPGAMATVIVLASRAPARMLEWVAALVFAMAVTLAIFLFADRLARLLGDRALIALERLMGLILTAFAVEMLLRGIAGFAGQLAP
jgi:MarC family membrane protein